MLYFIGFLNYEDEESVKRLDGQLVHECLTQLSQDEFLDYVEEDSRRWVNFTSESVKKLDLSHNQELADHVSFLLSDSPRIRCCESCGQVPLNQPMVNYRDYSGCVGRTVECVDCSPLTNEYMRNVQHVSREQGIEAAIQFLKELRD